jgi:hypothetical protein
VIQGTFKIAVRYPAGG